MKCLDSYPLVEISRGNPRFLHYLDEEFIIPDPVMAEFYWVLLRDAGELDAETWAARLKNYCVPVPRELLLKAIRFRFEHRKDDLSYFDAIGYVYAREHHLPFVTGDKAFKSLPGVEFVKV